MVRRLAEVTGSVGCSRLPVPWQELVDPIDWMIGDATDDIAEVCLGIEPVKAGGLDNGVHGGGAFSAGIGTGEQPVLSPQGNYPFILPMSGKNWKFITAGIPILAVRSSSGA